MQFPGRHVGIGPGQRKAKKALFAALVARREQPPEACLAGGKIALLLAALEGDFTQRVARRQLVGCQVAQCAVGVRNGFFRFA